MSKQLAGYVARELHTDGKVVWVDYDGDGFSYFVEAAAHTFPSVEAVEREFDLWSECDGTDHIAKWEAVEVYVHMGEVKLSITPAAKRIER